MRIRFGSDYRSNNPYQYLLYNAIGPAFDCQPASVESALHEMKTTDGPMIYHLHWEEDCLKGKDAIDATAVAQTFLNTLDSLVQSGAHLVWTRHNLRPHNTDYHELHSEMTPQLTSLASMIHVHSWRALEALTECDVVDLDKTTVIPHGNFVKHYAEWPTPIARRSFGLTNQNHSFLIFGRLGHYKQVAHAVEAFRAIGNDSARLIMVGAPDDISDLSSLPDEQIFFEPRIIKDDEVGRYFAAADTVLLPYAQSLTSGVALLAGGFARGVLGSSVPGIQDVVYHGYTGEIYDAERPNGLTDAMSRALLDGRAKWINFGQNASSVIGLRSWTGIGLIWRGIFESFTQRTTLGDLSSTDERPA